MSLILYPYMSKPQKEKNIEVPEDMLKRLLTASEVRMLKNRWQIIQYLEDGLSIRKVAEKVKVGTDTVVRVSKMREKLPKSPRQFKTQTPWIFGKND